MNTVLKLSKIRVFFSLRKGSFFPSPEFPHTLENGLFYFNKAFSKMLIGTNEASEPKHQSNQYYSCEK